MMKNENGPRSFGSSRGGGRHLRLRPSRSRTLRIAAWACAAGGLLAIGVGKVIAQAQIRNFAEQSILVLDTGGHNAPIRALAFSTPDGSQLLSAGFDKIVNVWSLDGGRLGRSRTIRPPIWSGYRGVIYAMALSPPAADRPRTLALAGQGVEDNAGNIGLYRFPGSADAATGDVEGFLPGGAAGQREPLGHTNTVMGLAFDPTGRDILASCSMDGTIRLWDPKARRSLAVLRGHVGPVNTLAFSPDGRSLVTGGKDGVLRLWDVGRRALRLQMAPNLDRNPNDRASDEILAVAFSPDGKWIVVGRENGLLSRYDAATLRGATLLDRGGRGAVEALAISPDGKWLATSIVANRPVPANRPRVECDVELRTMPDGRVASKVETTSNLVYACTFSPDSRLLAFAGGDAQGIYVKDLTDPRKAAMPLEGQGKSIWDVAFRPDSQAVGFSRVRADLPGAPETYEGFDLKTREVVPLDRAGLRGALPTLDGSTIRPTGPWSLVVTDRRGVRYPIALDPAQDRRWWSYSFIRPGPGHAQATVAIGCEGGVAIYVLDAGRRAYRRTRFFAGHAGPVYTLAPSPDGKWLATGSSDQTVRLWRLAGCDVPPPLGASFRPAAGGRQEVTRIEKHGFADAMGLEPGDLVEKFLLDNVSLDPKLVTARLKDEPSGTSVAFHVRRGGKIEIVGSRRRDVPALTLFPGLDREWVLWMPEGYYETSIAGDRRFLGWHRNPPDLARPADYFSADKFEKELRRPDVLSQLWTTADVGSALALRDLPQDTQVVVEDGRPPVVRILQPERRPDVPLVVQAAALSIRALARAEDGGRPIRSLRIQVDSRQGPRFDIDPGSPEVDRVAELTLSPGLHRVNVIATNDLDKERIEGFDLLYEPPQPKLPQLVVRSIGVGAFPDERWGIKYADQDAKDVEQFLVENGRTQAARVDYQGALLREQATTRGIRDVLAELDAKREKGELGDGDTILILLESHLLACDRGRFLVGSDAGPGLPPEPSLSLAEVTDALGRLADYGCRVMLLVDGVHASTPKEWKARVHEWARDLWKRNVIAFVASNQGASERLGPAERHGAFAQGILESLDTPSRSRLWGKSDGPITLRDFQEVVVGRVQDLTSRRQVPACYVPETLPSQIPLLDPQGGRPDDR